MFEAVTETVPVGPGDVIFGLPVGSRRIHSVETARRQLGFDRLRLRRLLAATMVLPPDDDQLSDEVCTFDGVAHDALLRRIANTMAFREACVYLKAQPRQVKALIDRELIVPFIADPTGGVDGNAFAQDALDDFLRRLSVGAVHRPAHASPIFKLCDASRVADVSIADLVAAMLDGRVKWRGRSEAARRFDTILVNVEEIRWVFSRRKSRAVPYAKLSEAVSTTRSGAKYLVDMKYFRIQSFIHPATGRPFRYISNEQIEKFKSRFISIQEIARTRGLRIAGLREMLGAEGERPLILETRSGAVFYARPAAFVE